MRAARRWLVWDHKKAPYYVNGGARGEGGTLDSPEDVARLASYDEAVDALRRLPEVYAGIGFALGHGWQGIDLDNVPENRLSALANDLPGYVELSPSGKGCHAIGYGRPFATLGNRNGVEAYAGGRYFTVTENMIRDGGLVCLADFVAQRVAPVHAAGRTEDASTAPAGAYEVEEVDARTKSDLRSALNFIPADDRAVWIAVGLALKTLGPTGRELWYTWSQNCPAKWDPVAAEDAWDTFRPTRTGWQSIFSRAQALGWLNPRSKAAQAPEPQVTAVAQAAGALTATRCSRRTASTTPARKTPTRPT